MANSPSPFCAPEEARDDGHRYSVVDYLVFHVDGRRCGGALRPDTHCTTYSTPRAAARRRALAQHCGTRRPGELSQRRHAQGVDLRGRCSAHNAGGHCPQHHEAGDAAQSGGHGSVRYLRCCCGVHGRYDGPLAVAPLGLGGTQSTNNKQRTKREGARVLALFHRIDARSPLGRPTWRPSCQAAEPGVRLRRGSARLICTGEMVVVGIYC